MESFLLPVCQIDKLLNTSNIADFYTLFALFKTFSESYRNTRKDKTPQLTNGICIADIARITGQDPEDSRVRKKIQASLKELAKQQMINYFYIPFRCLKNLDCSQSTKSLEFNHLKESREVEQNDIHTSIVFDFTEPPIVQFLHPNEAKNREKHREKHTIPVKIPGNFCHIMKPIVKAKKLKHNSIRLHKLGLWAVTRGTPILDLNIETVNQTIIKFDPVKIKCSKAENQELIAGLFGYLEEYGLIKSFKFTATPKPKFKVNLYVDSAKKPKSTAPNSAKPKVISKKTKAKANLLAPEKEVLPISQEVEVIEVRQESQESQATCSTPTTPTSTTVSKPKPRVKSSKDIALVDSSIQIAVKQISYTPG